MKKMWSNPDVNILDIEDTENGGEKSMDFDHQWTDQQGALHVNFKPAEDLTPTPAQQS